MLFGALVYLFFVERRLHPLLELGGLAKLMQRLMRRRIDPHLLCFPITKSYWPVFLRPKVVIVTGGYLVCDLP